MKKKKKIYYLVPYVLIEILVSSVGCLYTVCKVFSDVSISDTTNLVDEIQTLLSQKWCNELIVLNKCFMKIEYALVVSWEKKKMIKFIQIVA